MEHIPMDLPFSGNLFDDGVLYRCVNPTLDGNHVKDTLRAFIDPEHRDWESDTLEAHHIDSAKLFNWMLHGVTEGVTEGIARRNGPFFAVFCCAQGPSNAFEIDNEGSLRVFLQRVVNYWHQYERCYILFSDSLPAGATIYKEDKRICSFNRIKLEDGGD